MLKHRECAIPARARLRIPFARQVARAARDDAHRLVAGPGPESFRFCRTTKAAHSLIALKSWRGAGPCGAAARARREAQRRPASKAAQREREITLLVTRRQRRRGVSRRGCRGVRATTEGVGGLAGSQVAGTGEEGMWAASLAGLMVTLLVQWCVL